MLNSKGQMAIVVIGILMGFILIITGVVVTLQNETKWTLKERRTATAFHMAEAGIDQAIWKLNETTDGWEDALDGIIPTLYRDTTTFCESDRGYYKVLITTKAVGNKDQVIIQSVGTDKDEKEVRSIIVKYEKSAGADAAIISNTGVTFAGSADVHWGPVKNLNGNVEIGDLYPRKYAGPGYYVVGRDVDGVGGVDIGPTNGADAINQPLDEDYADWSSNGKRDVEDVMINLSSYSAMAKAYTTPANAPNRADADPANSGYYPSSVADVVFPQTGAGYTDNDANAVYYIEGNCDFKKGFLGPANGLTTSKFTLIVLGNLSLPTGSGTGSNYTVYVPTNVWMEYQTIDTDTSNQYPGDTGLREYANTCDVDAWASGAVVFHGMIYVGGNIVPRTGNKKIVGVVICRGMVDHQSGTLTFFYSKVVDQNIIYTGGIFRRKYWAEFVPGSFDTPRWK